MTPKELKKLAKACRDAGIKQFKNADIEFTLTDEVPTTSKYKQLKEKKNLDLTPQGPIQTDSLSPDELLFWSTGMTQEFSDGN